MNFSRRLVLPYSKIVDEKKKLIKEDEDEES